MHHLPEGRLETVTAVLDPQRRDVTAVREGTSHISEVENGTGIELLLDHVVEHRLEAGAPTSDSLGDQGVILGHFHDFVDARVAVDHDCLLRTQILANAVDLAEGVMDQNVGGARVVWADHVADDALEAKIALQGLALDQTVGIFKRSIKYSVIMDWTGDVSRRYGYPGGKAFVVIVDRDGVIRKREKGKASKDVIEKCCQIINGLGIFDPVMVQPENPTVKQTQ